MCLVLNYNHYGDIACSVIHYNLYKIFKNLSFIFNKIMFWEQPDFSDKPLNTEEEINDWLTFHDMSAPLVCLSEFVSHDPVSLSHDPSSFIDNQPML